jgi:transcriptional regulator with XRE-family HTH domain
VSIEQEKNMDISDRSPKQPAHLALAERIKRWRIDRGWNQQDLASRAGIARSTLSKIENGLLSPTFEVLLKVASGFDRDLSALVQRESQPLSGRMVIERARVGTGVEDRPALSYPNNRLWPLASILKGRAFQSAMVEFTQTDLTKFGPWNSHPTDDFLLVLSGQLAFHTDGYETALLNPGDTVHFDGRMSHACLNVGPAPCRCLYVYATKQVGDA